MDMGETVKETQINLFISSSENTFCAKKIHLSQLVTWVTSGLQLVLTGYQIQGRKKEGTKGLHCLFHID